MNTLQNEMQRYLQVIERAEADPEVWGKLTEGTGIATANGYRAALKEAADTNGTNPHRDALELARTFIVSNVDSSLTAKVLPAIDRAIAAAAQPVAPEHAENLTDALVDIIADKVECDSGALGGVRAAADAIITHLASQQVEGHSEEEVREAFNKTPFPFFARDTGTQLYEFVQAVFRRLASLSAKGEATHPSFDVIEKYGATHLIEKVPGTEVELSHLRHDQSVVRGDSKTFHYLLTKVDVAKGEAPKEKYGAVVRAEDGAPYDALAELIKRGIKLARLRADIKSDVEDAFYSQTVAIEIDGVRTTAVTHERFNRMLNVLYDRWLPRSTPAAPEGTVSAPVDLRAVLLAYEQWEADVIADNACWGAEGMSPYPILCDGHWDRFIEIQSMRNEALGTWSKVAPVTNSVDSSLSGKDANQNAKAESAPSNDEELVKSILYSYCRCTIEEEAEDVDENYHFKWADVVDAMRKYAATAQTGVVEALRAELYDAQSRASTAKAEWGKGYWGGKYDALDGVLKLISAAPKEGEQPEPDDVFARIYTAAIVGLAEMVMQRDCEREDIARTIVAAYKNLPSAPKPNPEPLVAALHQYISLLHDELNDLVPIAHAHGWRSHRHEEGNMLREKIATLTQWEASQPSPDSPKN